MLLLSGSVLRLLSLVVLLPDGICGDWLFRKCHIGCRVISVTFHFVLKHIVLSLKTNGGSSQESVETVCGQASA